MPNIAKVLKEEIARIARHEAKVATAPIRKPTVRLRKDVASLKARLAALEKAYAGIQALMSKCQAGQPEAAPEQGEKGWISGKGVKSLRKKLGLSQGDFAKLVGVSSQAVYMWESKSGMLKLRQATKAAVFAVRGIGAREARQRLAEMKPARRGKAKRARASRK